MVGTVLSINAARGFGFIRPATGRPDVFFHARDVVGAEFGEVLRFSDVEYELLGDNAKGPRAATVRPMS